MLSRGDDMRASRGIQQKHRKDQICKLTQRQTLLDRQYVSLYCVYILVVLVSLSHSSICIITRHLCRGYPFLFMCFLLLYGGRGFSFVSVSFSCFFFFSSRRRHTRCSRDWSSDVCSSDLSNRLCAEDDPLDGRY